MTSLFLSWQTVKYEEFSSVTALLAHRRKCVLTECLQRTSRPVSLFIKMLFRKLGLVKACSAVFIGNLWCMIFSFLDVSCYVIPAQLSKSEHFGILGVVLKLASGQVTTHYLRGTWHAGEHFQWRDTETRSRSPWELAFSCDLILAVKEGCVSLTLLFSKSLPYSIYLE